MNTIELIHQSSYDLTESERLEVFGYINMIKARFGQRLWHQHWIILKNV